VLNVAPGASTYVLTGYCLPHAPEDEVSGCSEPSDYNALSFAFSTMQSNGIEVEGSGSNIEIINSSNVCGGSSISFSNEMYFQDPIHLNSKGYCRVFTQETVQKALSCSDSEDMLNCETVDFEIYGLESNCEHSQTPNKGGKLTVSQFYRGAAALWHCMIPLLFTYL